MLLSVTFNVETMTLQDNLNNQNIELWNQLNSQFDFRLIYSDKEISWRVNTESNPIEIYTSSKTPNIASFTHELLHVYIESKGMSSSKDVLHSIFGSDSFQILTTKALFAKIHNYCSHTKMFPYFIKMGFAENLFLSDRISINILDYNILKVMFSVKKTGAMAVTDFIGNTMALFNDNDLANRKYTLKSIANLQKLNFSLFKIVEDFNIQWRNSEDLNLALYFKEFDNALNKWLVENKICM